MPAVTSTPQRHAGATHGENSRELKSRKKNVATQETEKTGNVKGFLEGLEDLRTQVQAGCGSSTWSPDDWGN